MRIVDNYNYLPGCCWICRGVSKPIIDMELDLDGQTSPDDPNPSSVTRLYICADCAIEIGRMMSEHRRLELNKLGELALYRRVADELGTQVEELEAHLASIAEAIRGVESTPTADMADTDLSGGEVAEPDTPLSESGPPTRKRALPRRKEPKGIVNVDFLGDL